MNILVGNIISSVAAVFTVISSLSTDRKRIYMFQVAQCIVMVIASLFFASYSGIAMYMLCALRNLLAAYDKFSIKICIIFVIMTFVIGIACNNIGMIGLFPVFATAVYTVGSSVLHTNKSIKVNIAVNLLLWAVYDIIICDYITFAVDVVSAAVTVYSLIKTISKSK